MLVVEPGPGFSVHDVHVGWRDAFLELGCQLVDLNFAERLEFYASAGRMTADGEFVKSVPELKLAVRMAAKGIEATCFELQPDVVVITSAFYVPLDTLDAIRRNGIKVVLNHTESPYEDKRQAVRAEHADINLLNDPTNLERFPKGTLYMPHAYRPDVHHAGAETDPVFQSEFCFVGTSFPSRIDFFEQVDFEGIDVALGGNWSSLPDGHELIKHVAHDIRSCLNNEETARFYRGALTSANFYRRETAEDEPTELTGGFSCGPREIELAACGTWFARDPRPESDELFPMLPTFETPAELGDLLRWALKNPKQRQAAADAARAAVASRTFVANATRLLQALDA